MTISRYLRLNRFVNIMFSEDMLEYQKIVIVQIKNVTWIVDVFTKNHYRILM